MYIYIIQIPVAKTMNRLSR